MQDTLWLDNDNPNLYSGPVDYVLREVAMNTATCTWDCNVRRVILLLNIWYKTHNKTIFIHTYVHL